MTPLPAGGNRQLVDLLRRVADHAPAAVFVKDARGRYLFVNRWMLSLFGRRERQLLGRTIADLVPEPLALRMKEHDRRVAAGEEVESEETFPTAAGDRTLMSVRFPLPLDDGSTGIFGIAIDVTERRRAEVELRRSEERFRMLADAMPQIVCVLGPDGLPEYVNQGWTSYSGQDLPATRAAGWTCLLHPEDVEVARETLRRALRERTPQVCELRYRAADRSHRWFLSRLAPVVEGGRVVRLVGAAVDIEDRRRSEEVLRAELAARDQLAKVAASVPGVVCSFRLARDGTASMPFSAPAAEDLYGLPRDLLARDMGPVFARFPPEDAARVREEIARSASSLEPWRSTFRYEHPRKGPRWMEGASIPSREDDGGVLWHGYVADVTDRKRVEDELREADRRKDDFLAMLAHELRNPLAPIRTALYVLERAEPHSPQAGRAREVAARQISHLSHLVDDLLDVTRIARGKIQIRREVRDLRDVIRRACEDQGGLFEETGLELRVELPDAPVWVEVDGERMTQVTGNLLHNARKFTPPGGVVTVALSTSGEAAELRVRDTGIGIEPERIERMFEPFEQEERGLARTRGGLGLGLALARGLIERQGGSIRAVSVGVGHGAEFIVTLPLAARSPGPAPVDRRQAPAAQGLDVLIIEDNVDAATSLADLLLLGGHRVRIARDGRTGIGLAREAVPDLVLCDLGLPDLDGFQVAAALRADPAFARTRLVAVSGYAQPEDREKARAAGFDAHLPKPTPIEELERLLRVP